MTTLTSPESRRDAQFNGRIMDTATFPTATFTLTAPAELPTDPATNATTATGDLTLRGVTKPVTLDVVAVDCGDTLDLVATTDIAFADFSIPDPSAPGDLDAGSRPPRGQAHAHERLMDDLRVGPTVTIPAAELAWRFSRSSGAGGQHVNTTDSRVELTWDLARSAALTDAQRDRARRRLAGSLVDGTITVTASERRSQLRNREAAHGAAGRSGGRRHRTSSPAAPPDAAVEVGPAPAGRRQEAARRDEAPAPTARVIAASARTGSARRPGRCTVRVLRSGGRRRLVAYVFEGGPP